MERKVRRTVSIEADIAKAIDEQIGAGTAESVSAFVETAVRAYLRRLEEARLQAAAGGLPAAEEARLIADLHTGGSRPVPWGVLNAR